MKHLALFLLSAVLLLAACKGQQTAPDTTQKADTLPLMVMQIRKCARLYTAEYKVHKIITHADDVKLNGSFMRQKFNVTLPMSHRKVAIPMDATLKASVDFSTFSKNNVVQRGDKIEIILPDPKVELTATRINHEQIKRHVSMFRSNFTDKELAAYEQQGRNDIVKTIPQLGIIEMARQSAANILVPIITHLGYAEENITITFRKNFTATDMPQLMDVRR